MQFGNYLIIIGQFHLKVMQTLYRKYRSQDFNEVLGQDANIRVLQKQVLENKVGHAYIFSGPRGTGKTTVARILAKAVNCKNPISGNPCNKCIVCKSISKGRFLDLIEIDAASNRGIDEIRKLRERVGFSPSDGKFKVYIIDEVHMLTKDAFNALLKTLEEPPEHVVFILATTEPHKIPQTILSRCQRFNFSLASDDVLLKKLKHICKKEGVEFSKESLVAIIKNSGGSFRDSESILEKVLGAIGVKKDNKVDIEDVRDILGIADDKEVQVFVNALLECDTKLCLKTFEKIASGGISIEQFIRQALEYSREQLVNKVSKKDAGFSLKHLLKVITELSAAENKLGSTQVKRLPVEVAIVKICLGEEIPNDEKSLKKEEENLDKKKIPKVVSEAISKIPNTIKTSIKDDNDLDIEMVQAKWSDVIAKITPFNHHLSAFFRKAKPVGIKGDKLVLEVPFKFHKQRIESSKAQTVFEEISLEVFGRNLVCQCEVVSDGSSEDKEMVTNNNEVVLEVLGDIIE